MLRRLSLVFILLAASMAAEAYDVPPKKDVYALARRVIPISEGARFITYLVRAPYAGTAAVLYDPIGDERGVAFTARDWIPTDVRSDEDLGTIFGAARLTDGSLAISFGWVDPSRGAQHGIAIFERTEKEWRHLHNFYVRGAIRDLAPGPDGSILALTEVLPRPYRAGDALPIMTIVDKDGHVLGTFFKRRIDEATPSRLDEARLQQVGTRQYALLDAGLHAVHFFEVGLDPEQSKAELSNERTISIAAVPSEMRGCGNETHYRALKVSNSRTVTVVRACDRRGANLTVVTAFKELPDGTSRSVSNVFRQHCNVAFPERGTMIGLMPSDVSFGAALSRALEVGEP